MERPRGVSRIYNFALNQKAKPTNKPTRKKKRIQFVWETDLEAGGARFHLTRGDRLWLQRRQAIPVF